MKRNVWQKRGTKFVGALNEVASHVCLRHTNWHWQRLEKSISDLDVKRLHLGCGNVLLLNWLNILYERKEPYGLLENVSGTLRLNFNLLKKWPVKDSSVEFIAASHFIEHLDLNAGINLLGEAFRVLKPNGVIRLSCPDLEIYAKAYVSRDQKFFNHPLIQEWCAFKNAKTPGEILAAKAYDSGGAHKWFYDFESLSHILEINGFKQIKRCTRLEGQVPDLNLLEPAQRELETIYVEAIKI